MIIALQDPQQVYQASLDTAKTQISEVVMSEHGTRFNYNGLVCCDWFNMKVKVFLPEANGRQTHQPTIIQPT